MIIRAFAWNEAERWMSRVRGRYFFPFVERDRELASLAAETRVEIIAALLNQPY